MDQTRIVSSIDVTRLRQAHVAIIGLGASRDLACNLCRSGVAEFSLFDPEPVDPENIARQGHAAEDIGQPKVEATAAALRSINPAARIRTFQVDFTKLADAEIDMIFADVDLIILATDHFEAQAYGNRVALRLGIPAVWIGLYAGGLGGEMIFWHDEIDACFRCLCSQRYRAHDGARAAGRDLDPPSDGVTILDVQLVDAIAGQIAIGLLTRGSDTRYGRLIDELGDRNLIQVKIDPHFEIAGRDVVREQLRIPDACETYFAWNAIARRDPDRGNLPCPDCEQFRGHKFVILPLNGFVRERP